MTIQSTSSVSGNRRRPATSRRPRAPQFREAFTDFVGQTFFGELLSRCEDRR